MLREKVDIFMFVIFPSQIGSAAAWQRKPANGIGWIYAPAIITDRVKLAVIHDNRWYWSNRFF